MKLFNEQLFSDFERDLLKKLEQSINSFDSIEESVEEEAAELSEELGVRQLKFDTSKYTHKIRIENVPVDISRGEMSTTGRKNIAVVDYILTAFFDEIQKKIITLQPSHYIPVPPIIITGYNPQQIQFTVPTRYATEKLPDDVISDVAKKKKPNFRRYPI